jgi:uncharacterized protein YceK
MKKMTSFTFIVLLLLSGCSTMVIVDNDTPFEVNVAIQSMSGGSWTTQDTAELDPYDNYSDRDKTYYNEVRVLLYSERAKYQTSVDLSDINENIPRAENRMLYVEKTGEKRFSVKEKGR